MSLCHDSLYPWTSSSTIFSRPVSEDNTLKSYSLGWLLRYGSTQTILPTRKQKTEQNKTKTFTCLAAKTFLIWGLVVTCVKTKPRTSETTSWPLATGKLIQIKDIPFSFLLSVCLCELSKTTGKITYSLKFCVFSTNWTLHIGQIVRSHVWHQQNSTVPSNVTATTNVTINPRSTLHHSLGNGATRTFSVITYSPQSHADTFLSFTTTAFHYRVEKVDKYCWKSFFLYWNISGIQYFISFQWQKGHFHWSGCTCRWPRM